jgi:hypothetical protein
MKINAIFHPRPAAFTATSQQTELLSLFSNNSSTATHAPCIIRKEEEQWGRERADTCGEVWGKLYYSAAADKVPFSTARERHPRSYFLKHGFNIQRDKNYCCLHLPSNHISSSLTLHYTCGVRVVARRIHCKYSVPFSSCSLSYIHAAYKSTARWEYLLLSFGTLHMGPQAKFVIELHPA